MNVTIDDAKKTLVAGDVIHYKHNVNPTKRGHGFYMVCYIENTKEYFLISLSGSKGSMKTYRSIDELIARQGNDYDIYTKAEFELKLAVK